MDLIEIMMMIDRFILADDIFDMIDFILIRNHRIDLFTADFLFGACAAPPFVHLCTILLYHVFVIKRAAFIYSYKEETWHLLAPPLHSKY